VAEYLVLARKWRPKTFEELVGQEHIARTLQNAIRQDKVAHAFLFSGPRGVGKTTTARILAKALNCHNGPTPTPCCKCPACVEIAAGNCLDVIEIDGASNNSVDDVRLLREKARYAPSRDRYKIYIIDEVHMLSTSAFNALLKTLEEPPAHVKFIFATTAPEKIPPTILSRCQRFNFRRIALSKIVDNLRIIAEKEGIDVQDEALSFIARKASGSLRDAQSILDQARSVCEGQLSLRDVAGLLSTTDAAFVSEFVDALIARETARVVDDVEKLYSQGANFRTFFAELIDYLHTMLLVLSVGESKAKEVLQLGPEEAERLAGQAAAIGRYRLLQYLNRLIAVENQIMRSSLPRVGFEVAVLGLCFIEDLASVETLLSKLSKVERMVAEGTLGTALPPRAAQARQKVLMGLSQDEKPQTPPQPKPRPEAAPAAPKKAAQAPEPLDTFLAKLEEKSAFLRRAFETAVRFTGLSGTTLKFELVRAPKPLLPEEELFSQRHRALLRQAAVETLGNGAQLFIARNEERGPIVVKPLPPEENASAPKPENEALYTASTIPVVKRTLQLFDGVIEEVRKEK